MSSIAPDEAARALNKLLLAAREAEARNIHVRIRNPKSVVQFSAEDWTSTYDIWEEDYAVQVMVSLFREIEKNKSFTRQNPPLEAVIARQMENGIVSKKPPVEIRAKLMTVMMDNGEDFDVILNLL